MINYHFTHESHDGELQNRHGWVRKMIKYHLFAREIGYRTGGSTRMLERDHYTK